jgi:hypothetical protein
MSRLLVCLSFLAVVGLAVGFGGCSSPDNASPDQPPQPVAPAATTPGEHAPEKHAGHEEPSQYADVLAKLPEADRALAEKQKACPVSGQPLGSMGTPVKVTVKGRDVLLCCQGCETAIQEDPDKYLAKLPE